MGCTPSKMAAATSLKRGVPIDVRATSNSAESGSASAVGSLATMASNERIAVSASAVVAITMPIREPRLTDASLIAAAEAGRPRGVVAKTMAVRTVVARTKPAPMNARGVMKSA